MSQEQNKNSEKEWEARRCQSCKKIDDFCDCETGNFSDPKTQECNLHGDGIFPMDCNCPIPFQDNIINNWEEKFKSDFTDTSDDWHKTTPEQVRYFIHILLKNQREETLKELLTFGGMPNYSCGLIREYAKKNNIEI